MKAIKRKLTKKHNLYREPVFKHVDYKEYYSYLETLDINEVEEKIIEYKSKGHSIINGIIITIIASGIIGVITFFNSFYRDIIKYRYLENIKEASILLSGSVWLLLSILFAIVIISLIYCKECSNKKYKMLIEEKFLRDLKKQKSQVIL